MEKIAGKHDEMTAHYQKNVNKNNDEKREEVNNIYEQNGGITVESSDGTSDSKTNDSRKNREL